MRRSLLVRDGERENVLDQVHALEERLRILERRVETIPPPEDFETDEVSWGSTVGGLLWMPLLRGLWPMSSVGTGETVFDVSGAGRTLTNNNTITFGRAGLAPYASFVGASSQYFSRAHEAELNPTSAGFWISTWVYFTVSGGSEGIVSKWVSGTNNMAYRIFKRTTDVIRLEISELGSASSATVDTAAISLSTWYHVFAQYRPSTSIRLWLNGVKTENTTSIPASIYNAAGADFEVGRTNGGNYMTGRQSLLGFGRGTTDLETIALNAYTQTLAAFGA